MISKEERKYEPLERALILPADATMIDAYHKGIKETIEDSIKDLEGVEHWNIEGIEYTPMNELRKIIEKWRDKK